jgi:hypothetical protein
MLTLQVFGGPALNKDSYFTDKPYIRVYTTQTILQVFVEPALNKDGYLPINDTTRHYIYR